jgi:hypothetical protein
VNKDVDIKDLPLEVSLMLDLKSKGAFAHAIGRSIPTKQLQVLDC